MQAAEVREEEAVAKLKSKKRKKAKLKKKAVAKSEMMEYEKDDNFQREIKEETQKCVKDGLGSEETCREAAKSLCRFKYEHPKWG